MGLETKSVVLPSQADAATWPVPGRRPSAGTYVDAAASAGMICLPACLFELFVCKLLFAVSACVCLLAYCQLLAASFLHMCTKFSVT